MNTIIVEQVIILILMMTVGFFLRKQGVFTNEVNKGLSYLLVNITLPAMMAAGDGRNFTPLVPPPATLPTSVWV